MWVFVVWAKWTKVNLQSPSFSRSTLMTPWIVSQLEPSPPQTRHLSSTAFDPRIRSHPTCCSTPSITCVITLYSTKAIIVSRRTIWNWFPYKMKDIKTIEKIQKRATKQVKQIRHLSYSERLKRLNLPTLRYRRHRGDMI